MNEPTPNRPQRMASSSSHTIAEAEHEYSSWMHAHSPSKCFLISIKSKAERVKVNRTEFLVLLVLVYPYLEKLLSSAFDRPVMEAAM